MIKIDSPWNHVFDVWDVLNDASIAQINLRALRNRRDNYFDAVSAHSMFFLVLEGQYAFIMVIQICKLLQGKQKAERSWPALMERLVADPPEDCDVAKLHALKAKSDKFLIDNATRIVNVLTYRDKVAAHYDKKRPENSVRHLEPTMDKLIEELRGLFSEFPLIFHDGQPWHNDQELFQEVMIDPLLDDLLELRRLRQQKA